MARWMAVALAIGCSGRAPGDEGDPDGDTAACAGDLALAVGTGEDAYEALADGQQVTMNHGPQGGWHVWAAVDATNAEPGVSIHPVMTVPDLGDAQVTGHQTASFVALVGYDPVACHGQHWKDQAFIDTDRPALDSLCAGGLTAACSDPQDLICALAGHEARLCLTAEDIVDGRDATGCATVTLELDPIDVAACAGTDTGAGP